MASWVFALLLALGQFGQTNTGELRLTVTDATGLPLPGPVDVVSQANDGSGLPFEDFNGTPEEAEEQFGSRVVDRVDFETGRVRPSAALDVSGGVIVSKSAKHALRVQAEVRNVTNRFDLINFAGLFSGTAIAAPRTFAVRLRLDYP